MPERMRVLMLAADLGFGGGENRILNLARSLDAKRFAVTVATLYPRDTVRERDFGSLHPEFEAAGIPVLDLAVPRALERFRFRPLQLAATAWTLCRAALHLRRRILDLHVDVVDAHMDGALLLAVTAAVLARVPIAVTLYHVHTVPPNRWLQPLRLLALRYVDAIVTDSSARVDDFRAALPDARAPVTLVPNGVRLPPPARSREEMFCALDLPEDATVVIGQISGFTAIKGHAYLLAAAQQVLSVHPRALFLCVGFSRQASAHVDSLHRQAGELGIADRVRLVAYPGPIADVWSVLDIHVHASTFDSLPNAILEGMSLGRPAVVTNVGGIATAVLHGDTGLVVPPRDAKALAEALLQLIEDPAFAARLGAAAQKRYREHYTPECCARAVGACLADALRAYRGERRSQTLASKTYDAC